MDGRAGMSTDGFPGAIWIPAHTDRYARRDTRTIDEIVLHITEGGTDKAEITAHNAFSDVKDDLVDGTGVSAGVAVGRDSPEAVVLMARPLHCVPPADSSAPSCHDR